MRAHEKHEKLQVLDVFEDDIDESQSVVMVEDKLEFPLEDRCTLFEEVHDSTTLETNHEEFFAFLREVHTPTPMDPSHDDNFALFFIIWMSWFFLLHPTLPNFVAFIQMKYG